MTEKERHYTLEGQVREYDLRGDYRVVTGNELEWALDALVTEHPKDLDGGATLSTGEAHLSWVAKTEGAQETDG